MLVEYFSDNQLLKVAISLVDILLVWVLVYSLLTLLKGTRGIQLVKGILIILLLRLAFSMFGFKTMSYIIDQIVTWGFLAIIIIFQPEIRKTLEHIGRFDLLNTIFKNSKNEVSNMSSIINSVATSSKYMARRHIGALIVLENETKLSEYSEAGVQLNAEISSELINNLFVPNTPLHDGALIMNDKKIISASCVLPLSDSRDMASSYGTRHRAALGLSEVTDAIIIVVSEETGNISVAYLGKLVTNYTEDNLRKFLEKNWLKNKRKEQN